MEPWSLSFGHILRTEIPFNNKLGNKLPDPPFQQITIGKWLTHRQHLSKLNRAHDSLRESKHYILSYNACQCYWHTELAPESQY
jgi:hypothetical protein